MASTMNVLFACDYKETSSEGASVLSGNPACLFCCVAALRLATVGLDLCCAVVCCVFVCLPLQELVSSSNSNPVLGDLFKHGQVVTARIWATNIGDTYESAGEMEGDQRRRCVCVCVLWGGGVFVDAVCFVQSCFLQWMSVRCGYIREGLCAPPGSTCCCQGVNDVLLTRTSLLVDYPSFLYQRDQAAAIHCALDGDGI